MKHRRRAGLAVTGLLSLLSLTLAACTTSAAGGPGGGTGGQARQGGTAVFAESAGAPPNYIFPLDSLQ